MDTTQDENKKELLRVHVHNGAASADLAARVAGSAVSVAGFCETEQRKVEQTVGTLASNIVEQHFDVSDDTDFTLIITESNNKICIRLEDEGLPFAIDRFRFSHDQPIGLLLDQYHDHNLRIEHRGDRGNALEIEFSRSVESLCHLAEQPELGHQPIGDDHPVSIRPLQSADAESLARCVYRCYGYTYAREWVYLPDELRKRLASGAINSLVGVDDTGEVVGHLGLVKEHPDDRVVECGIVVVDPRFRGHHLLRSLKKRASDELREQTDLIGYHADAVAVHQITQKANVELGGTEFGLLVDEIPATTEFRGLKQKPGARNSTVIYFHRTGTSQLTTVYAPSAYRDLLARMYERSGLLRQIEPPEPAVGSARVHAELQRKRNLARLTVEQVGADTVELVQQHLHEFEIGHVDVVQVDLPLAEAGAAHAVDGLRELGFGFATLIPERHLGDVLRLQYLHDLEVDPEAIDLYNDEARHLLSMIQSELAHDSETDTKTM